MLHELTPQRGSLEEAFMELTADSVEFGTLDPDPRAATDRASDDHANRGTRPPAATAGQPTRGPGFGHLLLAEWTKIRSVRSTVWSLTLLVVVTLGFTGLFTWLTVLGWNKSGASQRAQVIADPVSQILGSGLEFGQLTICVLGVLVISGEYSTGVIRASLLAVPKRIPMLTAKAVVFAAVVFVIGECVTSRRSSSARRYCTATCRCRSATPASPARCSAPGST